MFVLCGCVCCCVVMFVVVGLRLVLLWYLGVLWLVCNRCCWLAIVVVSLRLVLLGVVLVYVCLLLFGYCVLLLVCDLFCRGV